MAEINVPAYQSLPSTLPSTTALKAAGQSLNGMALKAMDTSTMDAMFYSKMLFSCFLL